ncbi:DUF4042 domain-containing protein [Cephalotus follicularis]|uniref:DUF4042 domain-containing protein n=1 Tax=Cephalotus follicularis TaxID=3775 RepID=A0A1Q3C4H6_CEPFO|nr:DUF4042 domain-containing protein [Cephalotus follicularis]
MAAASSSVRSWRTAFLTLRDETLTLPPSIPRLLYTLIFSHSQSLIAAAPDVPSHEVTSDLLFLLELVANNCRNIQEDIAPTLTHTCHLIHDVWNRLTFTINAASWNLTLDSFASIIQFFLRKAANKAAVSPYAATIRPALQSLETIRRLITLHHKVSSLSENIQLVKFLVQIIACCHAEITRLHHSGGNQRYTAEIGNRIPRYNGFWEVQTVAFTMLGEAFLRVGSSIPADIWQSTIEVLRKVMDTLASKSLLVEDNVMSRFYESLLHCLHLVLVDPKCSLADHLSGFIASLRMFFIYGLTSSPQQKCPTFGHKENELGLMSLRLTSEEPIHIAHTPYRPPHLRKKDSSNMKHPRAQNSQNFSDHETSMVDFTSSDSDHSDGDGSLKDTDYIRSYMVRVAAMVCIQDLCQADPKSFTTQWTMLLPTNDVLKPRKHDATLMTCLLFDPYLKARIESASTLAVMMDGPSSVFLQVAEYKESTKFGSFVALSSSLGQILMQLHTGILYLIERETQSRLVALLFKILMLLIACTPYPRMPRELLPTVITSLQAKIEEGFPFKSDQIGLLVAAISCLTAALSTSPSSLHVREMLLEEVSTGFAQAEKRSNVLFTLFQYSERLNSPTICFETFQALRAVSHNYPNIIIKYWEQVSTIVYKCLTRSTSEVSSSGWKGHVGNTGVTGEKVVTAAIKVLDECLRAISGFKGTEDMVDDKILDTPFTSDYIRTKKVSSAPSYGPEEPDITKQEAKACQSGSEQWSLTIEKHMPLILWHTSAMVRTASVTCFAGITSSVYFSLEKKTHEFIVSSLINSAVKDVVPSVRSAACRAIGVISCFPQISGSAEIVHKFIYAVEINARDPLASVRITASWALANLCDSLRHCVHDFPSNQSTYVNSRVIELLTECALHLTKDGDKIKSNAVRALGNLSRFVKYASSSLTTNNIEGLPSSGDLDICHGHESNSYHPALVDPRWLEKILQAFLSCVTTGNVKVQWNVCHALSKLFNNETLRLQDKDWASSVFSILLLLLRDSSNFKIRIQAAAALAIPPSILDYGKSFSDVVQGVEHILENLSPDQISAPSSLKYMIALEKQLTSTMLHVLSLAPSTDHEPLKDFLVKKASFLEGWFTELCSSLGKASTEHKVDCDSVGNQKKALISKALQSLVDVYRDRNYHAIAEKFNKLDRSI